jgi:hypothetical protein
MLKGQINELKTINQEEKERFEKYKMESNRYHNATQQVSNI